MLKELLTSTAVVLALASPAGGEEHTTVPSATANPSAAAALENPCAPGSASTSDSSDGDAIAIQSEDEGRMETLIGMAVTNPQDEEVGEVQDVLFTTDGNISGVVLSVGGFLGIGDKLVALPWNAVELQYDEKRMRIAATKDELDAAPPFKTLEQAKAEEQALEVQQEQKQQTEQNLQIQKQQQ